jgi:hypothetical protein
LPRARTYTEYAVTPSPSGSGFGSWKDALPSVPLASSTAKSAPGARLIFVPDTEPLLPRSTKMRWPSPPVMFGDLSWETPMMFRL